VPRLLLEYPNGRTHELDLEDEQRFNHGDEFELYGRRWRVIARRTTRNAPNGVAPIVVCAPLTESAFRRSGGPGEAEPAE
jgi:hypothetical protein